MHRNQDKTLLELQDMFSDAQSDASFISAEHGENVLPRNEPVRSSKFCHVQTPDPLLHDEIENHTEYTISDIIDDLEEASEELEELIDEFDGNTKCSQFKFGCLINVPPDFRVIE